MKMIPENKVEKEFLDFSNNTEKLVKTYGVEKCDAIIDKLVKQGKISPNEVETMKEIFRIFA